MRRTILGAAAIAAASIAAAPASAVISLDSSSVGCDLATGCLFNGNNDVSPGPNPDTDKPSELEAALLNDLGLSIDLIYLNKVDFPDGSEVTSGDWAWPSAVSYISIKSSTQFMFYSVAPSATSGSWTTDGLFNKKGNLRGISHYTLWGTPGGNAIPEPSTWAMMIAGFGLAGGALRSRRKASLAVA